MNRAIMQEIRNKVNELRRRYDIGVLKDEAYVEEKVKLYKEYLDYHEEFSEALVGAGCYLFCMTNNKCPDPTLNCDHCKRTVTHDIFLKHINHVP